MNDNSDPEVKVSTDILEPKEESETSEAEDKSIIIASDLFPEQLLIVPLYDRPLFPKMMLPVIISDEELEQHMMKVMKDSLKYIGLVFSFRENEEMKANFRRLELLPRLSRPQNRRMPHSRWWFR